MGRTAIEFRTHQYRWVSKRHSKNLFNCSNQFFKFTWKTIDRGCFELYLIKGGALHCIVNEVFREKLKEKNSQSGTKIVSAWTSVWTALIPNVKEEKKKICQATRRHIPLDSILQIILEHETQEWRPTDVGPKVTAVWLPGLELFLWLMPALLLPKPRRFS